MPTQEQLQNRSTWIDALESGRYQQGKALLKTEGRAEYRYCCLGVACEVLGLPETRVASTNVIFQFAGYRGQDSSAVMPDETFAEAYGVSMKWADDITSRGITMNDMEDKDFIEIAQMLREKFALADSGAIPPASEVF